MFCDSDLGLRGQSLSQLCYQRHLGCLLGPWVLHVRVPTVFPALCCGADAGSGSSTIQTFVGPVSCFLFMQGDQPS